jgi:hypothetical protein
MALIIGTPVRFRPLYARARGVDPNHVYKLIRLYRRPGDPSYWALLDGPPTNQPVKLTELH